VRRGASTTDNFPRPCPIGGHRAGSHDCQFPRLARPYIVTPACDARATALYHRPDPFTHMRATRECLRGDLHDTPHSARFRCCGNNMHALRRPAPHLPGPMPRLTPPRALWTARGASEILDTSRGLRSAACPLCVRSQCGSPGARWRRQAKLPSQRPA
jgi:hypothetical protein